MAHIIFSQVRCAPFIDTLQINTNVKRTNVKKLLGFRGDGSQVLTLAESEIRRAAIFSVKSTTSSIPAQNLHMVSSPSIRGECQEICPKASRVLLE